MMAGDPGLAGAIDAQLPDRQQGHHHRRVGGGRGAARCSSRSASYMAERVTDLRGVRDRTVARLLGQPEPGVPTLTTPSVLAAVDLAPAETATLTVKEPAWASSPRPAADQPHRDPGRPAGHSGVQATGILDVPFGTSVALDGGVGEIIVDPSEEPKSRRWPTARPAASGPWRPAPVRHDQGRSPGPVVATPTSAPRPTPVRRRPRFRRGRRLFRSGSVPRPGHRFHRRRADRHLHRGAPGVRRSQGRGAHPRLSGADKRLRRSGSRRIRPSAGRHPPRRRPARSTRRSAAGPRQRPAGRRR